MANKIISALTLVALLAPAIAGAQTITSISPSSAEEGSDDMMLTVSGTGFQNGSKVQLDGNDLDTTYVSATKLTAIVLADDLDEAGQMEVTVTNPNGSESNGVMFTVTAAETPALPETGFGPGNVPAWYAILMLALVAIAVTTIAWAAKRGR